MAEATHQGGTCLSDGSFELGDAQTQTLRVVVEAEPGQRALVVHVGVDDAEQARNARVGGVRLG